MQYISPSFSLNKGRNQSKTLLVDFLNIIKWIKPIFDKETIVFIDFISIGAKINT